MYNFQNLRNETMTIPDHERVNINLDGQYQFSTQFSQVNKYQDKYYQSH